MIRFVASLTDALLLAVTVAVTSKLLQCLSVAVVSCGKLLRLCWLVSFTVVLLHYSKIPYGVSLCPCTCTDLGSAFAMHFGSPFQHRATGPKDMLFFSAMLVL